MNTLKFGNSEWYGTEGNILAYNDENGNFKPLPFDFSRGSSATRVNQQGLIETVGANDARVDYLDNANGAMLLEPQRTNLIEYSEYFGSSYWQKNNATITDNATTSPEGVVNASAFTENTSTSTHFMKLTSTISASASTYYTASYFVKYNGRHFQILGSTGSLGGGYVNFDLINGEVGDSDQFTGSIEALGDGWYKCSGTNISTSSSTEIRLLPYLCTSKTSSRAESYVGDGTSGVYIYGAQVEQGSYPTSYIPTQGTVKSRLADSCSQTPPDGVIGQTEGTLFVEMTRSSLSESFFIILSYLNGTTAGSYGNSIYLLQNPNTNFVSDCFVSNSVQYGFIKDGGLSIGTHKIALSYKQNDFALYIDGIQIGTDNNGNVPTMNYLTIGGGADVLGHKNLISETKLYNTRLSNSELAALTQV
mgnify:CR=1 FL=1